MSWKMSAPHLILDNGVGCRHLPKIVRFGESLT